MTIRIFVKGLKNVHTLAAHIIEKGPQILKDAISEVEKLQAAQQLTATLLPSSTVNVMAMREINAFSVRNWATPHIIFLMCIVLSVMSMVT